MNIETMGKEMLIMELTVKGTELQEAVQVVYAVMDAIDETVAEGNEQLAELDIDIVAKQEAFAGITELKLLKQSQEEINSIKADVNLVKQVIDNKVKVMYSEIEDKAEQFFKVHKSALELFKTVDDYMLVNTTLTELRDVNAVMTEYANDFYRAFSEVRNVLLDTKIVAEKNQNLVYRGCHLGQIRRNTLLLDFEYKIQGYMQQLKAQGLLSY